MNVSRENEPPQSGFFSSEAEAQAQKIDQFLVTNVKNIQNKGLSLSSSNCSHSSGTFQMWAMQTDM